MLIAGLPAEARLPPPFSPFASSFSSAGSVHSVGIRLSNHSLISVSVAMLRDYTITSTHRPLTVRGLTLGRMAFAGWPPEAIEFYEGLVADNSKAYWQAHREDYERAALAPMLELIAELSPQFGEGHVFRPYRDVRFSADKSPYKTSIAADHRPRLRAAVGGRARGREPASTCRRPTSSSATGGRSTTTGRRAGARGHRQGRRQVGDRDRAGTRS